MLLPVGTVGRVSLEYRVGEKLTVASISYLLLYLLVPSQPESAVHLVLFDKSIGINEIIRGKIAVNFKSYSVFSLNGDF